MNDKMFSSIKIGEKIEIDDCEYVLLHKEKNFSKNYYLLESFSGKDGKIMISYGDDIKVYNKINIDNKISKNKVYDIKSIIDSGEDILKKKSDEKELTLENVKGLLPEVSLWWR